MYQNIGLQGDAGGAPEGNDEDAMLLQQWYEVLGCQWAGIAQVEDHNVGMHLVQSSNAQPLTGGRRTLQRPPASFKKISAHINATIPGQGLCQGPHKHMPWQLCLKATIKQGRAAHQVSADVNVGARGQPLCQQEGIVMIIL